VRPSLTAHLCGKAADTRYVETNDVRSQAEKTTGESAVEIRRSQADGDFGSPLAFN
jgi:hypothetical protein